MRRHLISTVVILTVLTVAWMALGQEQSDRAQRFAQYRQAQAKAIETIQEQAGKLKAAIEESARRDFSSYQDLSEDERANLREEWTKRRQQWQQAVRAIEEQIVVLKGSRRLRAENEESIAELRAVHALAVSEEAEKTTRLLEEMIRECNKEYDDIIQKLGFRQLGQGR